MLRESYQRVNWDETMNIMNIIGAREILRQDKVIVWWNGLCDDDVSKSVPCINQLFNSEEKYWQMEI